MKLKVLGSKLFLALLVLLAITSVLIVGCRGEEAQPTTTKPTYNKLTATLVPNINLDLYVYIGQDNPTMVPKEIIGSPFDLIAESLSLWGLAIEEGFTLGGKLTLTNANDAAQIFTQIPSQSKIWASVKDNHVYFVGGSGVAAEALKTPITKNDFKYYDDQEALAEVMLLPDGGTAKLVAVAVARPSQSLLKVIAKNIAPEASNTINTLQRWARLQIITAGLYTPQYLDITEILQGIEQGTIWESNLGILVSVKSELPGFLVSPIAGRFLDNAGFPKLNLGELTIYQGILDIGNGKTVPVLLRIEGSRIFISISGQKSYAEELITSIGKSLPD